MDIILDILKFNNKDWRKNIMVNLRKGISLKKKTTRKIEYTCIISKEKLIKR
jgi:hypothetical protein